MTGWSEGAALEFLYLVGALDLLVAAAVLAPARLAKPALAYAAIWGLLTALARGAAFIRWENLSDSTAQWLHEVVMRLPHAAVPAVLFLALRGTGSAACRTTSSASPSAPFPARSPDYSAQTKT